jgi:hypothetical protein
METVQENATETKHKTPYKMLTGMFDYEGALCAWKTLIKHGYTKDEINLMMSEDTHRIYFKEQDATTEIPDKTASGAGIGAAIGGTSGAIAGVALALGISVAIPGLGFVLTGAILAGLSGATAGVITGGLIGALGGIGIPEDIALLYKKGIEEGKIVMSIHPHSAEDAHFFENDWLMCNAKEMYH